MDEFSADEFVKVYGENFGKALFYTHNHWCRLFVIFIRYANLFGKSKERVELLNKTAGGFFGAVQDNFHNEIMLGICRLTDPAKIAGKSNLTIRLLPEFIKDSDLRQEVETKVSEAVALSKFARDRRNKFISHSDLAHATHETAYVPSGSIVEIRAAIKSIHNPIRLIRMNIEDVDTRPSVIGTRSEFSLLRNLFEAQLNSTNFEQSLRDKVRGGDYSDPYPDWLFSEDEVENWM